MCACAVVHSALRCHRSGDRPVPPAQPCPHRLCHPRCSPPPDHDCCSRARSCRGQLRPAGPRTSQRRPQPPRFRPLAEGADEAGARGPGGSAVSPGKGGGGRGAVARCRPRPAAAGDAGCLAGGGGRRHVAAAARAVQRRTVCRRAGCGAHRHVLGRGSEGQPHEGSGARVLSSNASVCGVGVSKIPCTTRNANRWTASLHLCPPRLTLCLLSSPLLCFCSTCGITAGVGLSLWPAGG
jgi:hypothetical protein